MWVGIEDMTDLARVTLPAIVKVFVFQLAILEVRAVRIGEKSECLEDL